jgi:hypothetical protein
LKYQLINDMIRIRKGSFARAAGPTKLIKEAGKALLNLA